MTAKVTIMSYISGDNSLRNFGVASLQQMQAAASSDVVVAAYLDTGIDVRRFIFKGQDQNKPLNVIGKTRDRTSAGHAGQWENLCDFIASVWRDEECAADEYILDISGHGAALAVDEHRRPRDFLTPIDLANAITQAQQYLPQNSGKKLTAVCLDACFMAMVELAYELPEDVEFLVASEGEVPYAGFAWYQALTQFNRNELSTGAAALCTKIGEQYKAAYKDYIREGVTLSKFDLAKIRRDMRLAFKDLVAALQSSLQVSNPTLREDLQKAIVAVRKDTETFASNILVDVGDFCHRLALWCSSRSNIAEAEIIGEACAKLEKVLEPSVNGPLNVWKSDGMKGHGCAAYWPLIQPTRKISFDPPEKGGLDHPTKAAETLVADFEGYYRRLAFSMDTGWYDFVSKTWHAILAEEVRSGLGQWSSTGTLPDDFEEHMYHMTAYGSAVAKAAKTKTIPILTGRPTANVKTVPAPITSNKVQSVGP